MATQASKRRDRFDRRPRKTKDGRRINSEPTPRDLAIVYPKLLEYRVLRADYIHAFTGGNYDALANHLSRQALEPHLYLQVVKASSRGRQGDFNFFLYELGPGGKNELRKKGYVIPEKIAPVRFVDHKNLECIFEASIELGTIADPSVQRIWGDELKAKFPKATQERPDPFKIPVFGDFFIRPDGHGPFLLSYDDKAFRLCVFEADCDTESDNSEYTSSIRFKVEAYLHILHEQIYRSHFGSQTFVPLFVTTDPDQERKILKRIESVIEEKKYPKDLARSIGVTSTVLYTWYDLKAERAGGHFLTRGYKRAFGLPDLYISKP
ncbi:Conserved protein of unknown function [Bradyrhizobium sp. ORS 285]|uniref:hypothetical protein n=1 Tax=Bradyrhizobium sp. ORS 285 TaxID=115808 RepID=UPI0002409019|nr:hypothetical protein [Bradyrhizobium sp. ORS 285]CCD89821.1 Conserved hypothetical protein [Bradyrhizobium sp. ORS 285]SMX61548.1 Conserved protein of unknown function [Bradyrhizobium sp. ORS 285]